MEHFNKLTPKQAECLAILAEEPAEVIQAVGKILRHGYDNWNPERTIVQTNRTDLAIELAHLQLAMNRVIDNDLDSQVVTSAFDSKLIANQYLHHQD